MAKARLIENPAGTYAVLLIDCPGCRDSHLITVRAEGQSRPVWTWNGSLDAPTVTPSLLCEPDDPANRCHSFITDGRIQFLADCHHALAGQTVLLPEVRDR